ncbi:MAG: competence/damage-inducible protein A [Flavobacteriaceae bacterium]|nr:competence/damage-inducible protein A [Flavobacteriaceae bacterium]
MQATLITIGDEILIGQILDTNSAFIAQKLNEIGIEVHEIISVHDSEKHILDALEKARANSDITITTGGLGPTKDDITKQTFCRFFDDTLKLNNDVLTHVEHLFAKYVNTPISEMNRRQAWIPASCEVLFNRFGTAPGMWFDKDGHVTISLPGVPYEMKALLENEVLPKLQKRFQRPFIFHKTILTIGLGESAIAERIEKWEDALPAHIKLAYLPNLGKVRLRLSAKGQNGNEIEEDVNRQIDTLLPLITDIFAGFEDQESLEVRIARLMCEKNLTLSLAESCTGGQLATSFTKHPGASQFFKGSLVTYATSAKTGILGVSAQTIENFSVVSEEVAQEMAVNARVLFETDFAISTTGNAGPTKGDSDAEVGTVCIAMASKSGVVSEKFSFGKNRERVVGKAINKALEWLLKEISKK